MTNVDSRGAGVYIQGIYGTHIHMCTMYMHICTIVSVQRNGEANLTKQCPLTMKKKVSPMNKAAWIVHYRSVFVEQIIPTVDFG